MNESNKKQIMFNMIQKSKEENQNALQNRKDPRKKSIYFQKSSSGVFSSIDSCEDYVIETNTSVPTTSSDKRNIEFSLPNLPGSKKLKLDNTAKIEEPQQCLQDTLDSVNISKLLEKSSPAEKNEYDAFANYLSGVTPKNNASKEKGLKKDVNSSISTSNEDLFGSQFLDTQTLNQIDINIEKNNTSLNNNVKQVCANDDNKQLQFLDTQTLNQIDISIEKNNTPLNNNVKQICANSSINDDTKQSQFLDTQALNQIDSTIEKNKKPLNNNKQICANSSVNDDTKQSQFLDTQSLNQIDSTIEKNKAPLNNNKQICANDSVNNDIKQVQKEGDDHKFAVPLKLCFKERIKSKVSVNETLIDKEIGERTVLFENEKVTTEYRREVDQIFEQIENSICAMGEESSKYNIPEEFLDIIFNDDFETSPDKKEITEKPSTSSDSQLSTSRMDLSFGSLIKKALIKNSTKSPGERKKVVDVLNLSINESKSVFVPLGPFYGLPLKVKQLIQQYKGIEELYDWQDECLKLPAIESKRNLIYGLPTSGGKTLVAEILMFRELLCCRKNAIFILPYVSIVQEKVWAISPFGVALDFLVEEYASNKGVYPPRKRRRKNSIYIATIEKALGIINSLVETGRLHEVGLIVVDEFHLIGEDGRGPTLEASLTKIMYLKANIQIIAMSATIGNIADLCKFLNADVYTKNFRPVELTEYVKCTNKIAKVNWNYTNEEDILTDHKKIDFKYSDSIQKLDPDMLGGLVMEVIPNGSCLIFCPSKKNCENVANLLCKLCKPELKKYKQAEKEQLIHALKDEGGILCDILAVSIQYGIAYHHSGLTSDERRIIEEGFRAGIIYVICCTSTLAAGVNLPAKRVILRSPYIGKDFINLSRYKQMVGRAGRAGLGETGESILITQPPDLPKVVELMMSPMNRAMSGMHLAEGKGLRHLLLSCISLGIANTRAKLHEVTAHTLLSVQSDQQEVNIKQLTDKVIKNLFKLGALKELDVVYKEETNTKCDVSVRMDTSIQDTSLSENIITTPTKKRKRTIVLTDNTKLVVSELGCAAIKGGLELSRAHVLYEDLYEAQACLVLQGHLHLLYLVTPYETADQIKPNKQVYYEVFTRLKPSELRVAKTLGLNESVAVKMFSSNNPIKSVPERIINRFYVTLMLYDLWNEMPVFQVSEKYQINRGIVQNLMTIAATFASNVVNFCEELEEFWAYAFLLKGMSQRLSHCCVKELLPLMDLPAVKQSRAKQLYNAGFKTLQSIAKANVNDLVQNIEFMSTRVANQLIAASKMLLLEKVENLREEAEDVLDGADVTK
ncbi:helicase POLQ-like [Diabrotica virgifera virgifera]|uniref:Helicase POLQ-like n=1 Tax=Diabrotica virgifera virgifera TaxID=50390 RepID=A0ABM5JMX2_DIAVI|nr:helicase POLQ-like [Diabrotica virgifera virgifera]XP_050499286.1 helicase POLQ-like [Diabrotica virgifera virgifera]